MHRYRVYVSTGAVLAASWLSLVLLNPVSQDGGTIRIGYFLGSLYAHATLAAGWCIFGPGAFLLRVPLSTIWAATLPAAIATNFAINGIPNDAVLSPSVCLVAQWLLLQFSFAGIALGFGVQLRHTTAVQHGIEGQRFRFGIRDLLIVMAICSVILGVARVIVPGIPMRGGHNLAIFIFLAVAAVVTTVPLLLAALLRRRSLLGVLLSLLLIAVATAWELPIMRKLGGLGGPTTGHFIAINTASAALILATAGVVRLNGYCLSARRLAKDT